MILHHIIFFFYSLSKPKTNLAKIIGARGRFGLFAARQERGFCVGKNEQVLFDNRIDRVGKAFPVLRRLICT